MNKLPDRTPDATNVCQDPEYILHTLAKPYEALGFTHHFYLENGLLVCSDDPVILNKPVISIQGHHYHPKGPGLPHGFCFYALTVMEAAFFFKGIFLLPQGVFTRTEISGDVAHQLQLHHWYPQIYK
ncbi:hypothetical protein [Chitinophaga nivalis]|uniref:Uncharacterized protein n=1 Tax=Chitinophaga nivalis TaxID=2991709 RepID=A0ABT3IIL1_9BACT|nr:hypothetical protein [Chitinophaga nivalis]MCW3466669.1 hypothetical protein [Chitinophaga nivalis]MCW3483640.1 hypothetical protein [Chitinophaga nivalis]